MRVHLERALQRDTTGAGCTVAQLHWEGGPSAHWGGRFHPYVNVSICDYQGGKGWLFDGQLELADLHRTQWNICRRYVSREDAAREAAAFTRHAIELLERSLAGEEVVTPGQRRQRACEAAWQACPDARALRATVAELERALGKSTGELLRLDLQSRLTEARDRTATAWSRFEQGFHAQHHWSAFTTETRRAA